MCPTCTARGFVEHAPRCNDLELSYRGAWNGHALAYLSAFLVHECKIVPIPHTPQLNYGDDRQRTQRLCTLVQLEYTSAKSNTISPLETEGFSKLLVHKCKKWSLVLISTP